MLCGVNIQYYSFTLKRMNFTTKRLFRYRKCLGKSLRYESGASVAETASIHHLPTNNPSFRHVACQRSQGLELFARTQKGVQTAPAYD
jgi:hypothetical protein